MIICEIIPFIKRYHFQNSHKPNSCNGFVICRSENLIKAQFEYYLISNLQTKGNIFIYVENGVHFVTSDI